MTARSPAGAVPADAHLIASAEEALTIARAFAQAIAPGAVARDRDRQLPTAELEQLGRSGLLALPVPRGHGGAQASRETVVEVLRIISAADPSIGQIPQNHLQLLDAIARYGDAYQRELFFAEVLRGARFGNAWVERGTKNILEMRTRLRAAAGGDGYRLVGRKYYCTGALTAQWVPVAALDDGHAVFAFVPRDAEGLTVEHHWSAFGQRATMSGTTILDDVAVRPEWVIRPPHGDREGSRRDFGGSPQPSTFGAVGQILHAAVDVGIGQGALEQAVELIRTRSRAWFEAEVDRPVDEPHIVLRFGQFQTRLHAAEALLRRAAQLLDAADRAPGADAITAARLAVAEAKAFGGEVALEIAGEVLELLGTAATDEELGFDRHWRNVRTHTLHDANRFKYVHVGRHLLTGAVPAADNPVL